MPQRYILMEKLTKCVVACCFWFGGVVLVWGILDLLILLVSSIEIVWCGNSFGRGIQVLSDSCLWILKDNTKLKDSCATHKRHTHWQRMILETCVASIHRGSNFCPIPHPQKYLLPYYVHVCHYMVPSDLRVVGSLTST